MDNCHLTSRNLRAERGEAETGGDQKRIGCDTISTNKWSENLRSISLTPKGLGLEQSHRRDEIWGCNVNKIQYYLQEKELVE